MTVGRASLFTLTAFALGALCAAAVGCSNDDSCASDSECFAGEVCQSGECVETKPTLSDAGTGADTDSCSPKTWYADSDGDGFGDSDETKTACKRPENFVDDDTDCDDDDKARHPDATETCNGVDDDCDDAVDNLEGAESCSCTSGQDVKCIKQEGICSGKTVTCKDGTVPKCGKNEFGSNYESGAETTCDNEDNDCDGSVDEGLQKDCPLQKGVCSGAKVTCSAGSFSECGASEYGPNFERREMSDDGKDNDCDGVVDNYVDTVEFGASGQDDYVTDLAFDPMRRALFVAYQKGSAPRVARYDRAGERDWSEAVASPGSSGGVAIHDLRLYTAGQSTGGMNDEALLERRNAQTGSSNWKKSADVDSDAFFHRVAVHENSGVVYAVGTLKSSSGQGDQILVEKWGEDGTHYWRDTLGGSDREMAANLVVDQSTGDIYVTGVTASSSLAGKPNPGKRSSFLIQYSSLGTREWVAVFGSARADFGTGLAYDTQRKAVYVSGYTKGSIDGEPSNGRSDGYLARFDRSGKRVWTRLFGTGAVEGKFHVAVDESDGALYLAGTSEGDFGGVPNTGGADVATVKYTADGTQKWKRLAETPSFDRVNAIALDPKSSDLYVGGLTFPKDVPEWAPDGERDAFWMRLKR